MRLLEMPAADYYADRVGDTPTLSQSCAHTLLSRSPYHAWLEHPRLGGQSRDTTAEMDAGTTIHDLLLGGNGDGIVILPFPDYRTKAAQTARDEAYAAGKTPIIESKYLKLQAAAEGIRQRLNDFHISLAGQSELTALWTERADDGSEVHCRGRIDHWLEPVILDLKTTSDAHPDKCVKSSLEHGYDLQAAAYLSAFGKILPDMAGRIRFLNVFCELESPHLITPMKPSQRMLALGESKWRRAVNLWSRCLRNNDWPAYATSPIWSDPPQWALLREAELSPSFHPEEL